MHDAGLLSEKAINKKNLKKVVKTLTKWYYKFNVKPLYSRNLIKGIFFYHKV
ncbi:hypothetical protein GCM10012290_20190 [Halolactibacillus alkaliphilus]|uniref:Uncharacterized protein n=1 Tax=Halolactibacillus alkaliphilus TaxID=442899 RepID=A0A511X3P1_9BACI|nr:hypothetical protein HAL01_20110 [Halolactibacillus alkaliphilus]GGN73390.1 hypothetical protein GCM10012290_20190 [Halolactibacillus alkaliphilus]